ncbi:MAG: PAS domain S-box protein [Proteobacteria bacterium]|nr:PAS domain S-box protein [Pseudomonadota bacterium]MBU1714485.1 PAS domain S-box protein [Pseudomonadota bacterium]
MKLRSIIFITAFALGIIPLLTLVAFNLSGHIKRHEQSAHNQTLTQLQLNQEKLDAEIIHLKSLFQNFIQLPEVRQLTSPGFSDPGKNEIAEILNHWFKDDHRLREIIFFNQQDTVISYLKRRKDQRFTFAPFSAFPQVVPSLAGARIISDQAGTALISLAAMVPDNSNPSKVIMTIDINSLLSSYENSYWLIRDGSYLHKAAPTPPSTITDNGFKDFAGLDKLLAENKPVIWDDGRGQGVAWMPLAFVSGQPLIWIGNPVDRTAAEQWKSSLIHNIITIIVVLAAIIFLIANAIAKKIDSIKEKILTGLNTLLNEEKETSFNWTGPREIRNMAEELSLLARRYIKNVLARKEAEAAFRDSELNFRNLTNSAQDAIVIMDHKGNISYWNLAAEEIFGYSKQEALGHPIHSLISPKLSEQDNRESINSASDHEGPIKETIELVATTKDGSELPIELSLSEARIQDQWHSIWIIRDISERKRAAAEAALQQQQLRQADKMISLGLLVSGVAHEINNPNSIALLNTPLLARSWESIRPVLEEYHQENGDFLVAGLEYSEMRNQIPILFQELEESGRRIKTIVQDLKDYARQDTTSPMETIDLTEVVKAAVRLTHNQTKNATDHLLEEYAEDLPKIKGNSQRLEQVVINLIQNSCEAMTGKEGAIRISTSADQEKQTVTIEVKDDGCGIATEKINQITDPFYTTKRSLGGTGLGLSVSAGIIKEHNGQLRFESVPGKGTTAWVTFPACGDQ